MATERDTPAPDALTQKALDLRTRRPWVFYRLDYDELRKFTEREADRADAAEADRQRLREYAQHKRNCAAVPSWPIAKGPCSCGLAAALGGSHE